MERFGSELAFDLPSSGLNFDFSAFPSAVIKNGNRTTGETDPMIASISSTTATANFLRVLSEKIGRGLSASAAAASASNGANRLDITRNQVILNGTAATSGIIGSSLIGSSLNITQNFPNEDFIRQAEYDKFMNEIWIGIVLTLIVISMVFCICSCFLYHQFRQWKNNYHRNLQQSNDIESVKLSIDDDDLPSYTLVSGLPSYDAALEQMQKSSVNNSCLLMYPSVFKIFATNEKQDMQQSETSHQQHQQHEAIIAIVPSYQEAIASSTSGEIQKIEAPSYKEALLASNSNC